MIPGKKRLIGQNQVMISGYVDGRILSGTTGDGEEACSFSVVSADSGHKSIYVRVNAYGRIAKQCIVDSGDCEYCVITGELMNRPGKFGKLTELRAKKVEFIKLGSYREDKDNVEPEE